MVILSPLYPQKGDQHSAAGMSVLWEFYIDSLFW